MVYVVVSFKFISICILKTPHFTLFKSAGLTVFVKRILVPRDVRVAEVNMGQVRQRTEVFNVPRDGRVVEHNLDQVQQRVEVHDVPRDARPGEVNIGQLR